MAKKDALEKEVLELKKTNIKILSRLNNIEKRLNATQKPVSQPKPIEETESTPSSVDGIGLILFLLGLFMMFQFKIIWFLVGFGFVLNNIFVLMRKPGVQKPH